MIPELNGKNAYAEVTNLNDHGGEGWEVGTCIWSPVKDKSGKRKWKIMNNLNEGDLILHFVRINNVYSWIGTSLVAGPIEVIHTQLPSPHSKHKNPPFQRILLKDYKKLETPISTDLMFKNYKKKLVLIRESSPKRPFYTLKENKNELEVREAYLTEVSIQLYNFFGNLSRKTNLSRKKITSGIQQPTDHEPVQHDIATPDRTNVMVSRIVRDTSLSRRIKNENDYSCLICGKTIILPNGNNYAEGHHLKPLGKDHDGLDIKENIIILCPNHHTEFDYGSISIEPNSLLIEHIDNKNKYHGKPLAYRPNDLLINNLKYHHTKIFNKF